MKVKLFNIKIIKTGLGFFNRLNEDIRERLLVSVGRESKLMTDRLKRGSLSSPGPYSLARRTGTLAASTHPLGPMWMGYRVLGGVSIGENVRYTKVHVGTGDDEQITTIFPKKAGGALAIPLRAAKDSRGVLKPEYRVGTLRQVPGLFAMGGILWKRSGVKGKGKIPLFLLRSSVRIEKRVLTDMVAAAEEKHVRAMIENDMNLYVAKQRGLRVY